MLTRNSARAFAALMAIPNENEKIGTDRWADEIMGSAKAAGLQLKDYLRWRGPRKDFHGPAECAATEDRWETIVAAMYGAGLLYRIASDYGWALSGEPQEVWDKCIPVPETHRYFYDNPGMHVTLRGKLRMLPEDDQTKINGIELGGNIVAPMQDAAGKIVNLEFLLPRVTPYGGVRNRFAFRSVGWFSLGSISSETERIYICNSAHDAWLCSELSGEPAVSIPDLYDNDATVLEVQRCYPNAELIGVPTGGKTEGRRWVYLPETLTMRQSTYTPYWDEYEMAAALCDICTNAEWSNRVAERRKAADLEREAHLVAIEAGREGGRAYKRAFDAYVTDNTPEDEVDEAPRYNLIGGSDLAKLPPLAWRVSGVFPSSGVVGLYGASGSGKSFLAFDFAAAVASGTDWFGRKVEATSVVYIVLENDGGFPQRVSAWEQHNKRKMPSTLKLIMEPFNLTSDADIAALAEVIPSGSVVIIDTLNRAAPTVDENSSQGMGRILEASKSLQMQTAGLVVLVHHTGKDESRGARGHSSLYAALDAAILVSLKSGKREWSLHKAKDDRDGDAFPFSLETVTLGISPTGDKVSSCVVLDAGQHRPSAKGQLKLSVPQRKALDALRYLIEKTGIAPTTAVVERYPGDSPEMAVAESAWKRAAIQAGIADADADPKSKSKAFTRAKNSLLDLGLVSVFDDQVWTT